MSMIIYEWRDPGRREYLINSFNLDSPYNFPLHSHQNHWEIVYCEEGSFHHQVNGISLKQSEGEMIFIRETDTHLLKGKDFKYSNIAFSGAWIDSLVELTGSALMDSLIDEKNGPTLIPVPRKFRTGLEGRIRSLLGTERSGRSELRFSHFLHYVFDSFLLVEDTEYIREDIPDWLQDLLRYINRNDEPLPDLETLVARSYRCAEHVSRSFKKYLGVTPTAYIRDVRLNRAAELLRSTNFPVKEICFLCSYENPNYFHRQFRGKFGMTPVEYRRSKGRRIH